MRRIPIKVTRCAIKIPQPLKLQMKLAQLEEETKDDDIVAISEHYNMLAARATNNIGYTSLASFDIKAHKNWKHFESVWHICRLKGWSYKLYLEAQFDRSKYWTGKMRFPMPSMLYSMSALRYFTNHLADIRSKYKQDTGAHRKEKGSETRTVREQVMKDIMTSIEGLDRFIRHSASEDKPQLKAIKIFQSWWEYSPYYLWSIPWFHKALDDLPQDDKDVIKCIKSFESIRGSRLVQEIIGTTVQAVEQHFGIPPNIEL